jgi:hypothetical protein
MVVRRDQRETLLFGQLAADGFAVFGVAVEEHHLAAVAAGGFHLHNRCVLRHDDDGTHAEQLGRQRNRLRVVARRKRDDARLALLRRELRQRVVRTAKLERTHALEALGLEEQLGAGHGIGGC